MIQDNDAYRRTIEWEIKVDQVAIERLEKSIEHMEKVRMREIERAKEAKQAIEDTDQVLHIMRVKRIETLCKIEEEEEKIKDE